jgi:putative ABC transport system permease protein
MRQLLIESLLLSLAGGVAAVMLAFWGTNLLVSFKPENLPRLSEIGVDGRVLGFTLGISVLTGLIFGLAPAWAASRDRVGDALKEGGRSATAGSARQRLRSAFVVAELAVALVLLVGAGLLIKTFWKLRSVEPGFNPDRLLTMRIELPETRYKAVPPQTRFRKQVLAGMNSLPGVQAAIVSELPLSGESLNHDFLIENRPPIAPGDEPSVETRSVLGDYFNVMQIPFKQGRDFGPPDFDEKAPLVGIANEALVQQYFQNEDPLGKHIRWARNPEVQWITIVGVVGDVKHFGLDLPEQPALYTPYTQINPLEKMDVNRRANTGRCSGHCPGAQTGNLESRFATAGNQGRDHERSCGELVCGTPLQHVAVVAVCRSRPGAGCNRNLRRHVECGNPTNAGNRYSASVGRARD